MTARFDMLIFGLRFDLFFRVVWRPGEQEAPALTAVLRPRRLAWPRTSPFHGGNTGSNPVGDAKSFQEVTSETACLSRYTENTLSFGRIIPTTLLWAARLCGLRAWV